MRAIRDEYTKLPGIRFGWVMGKTAVQVGFSFIPFLLFIYVIGVLEVG